MTTVAFKPEILVIDDEIQIRRLLQFTLEEAGYAVRSVGTGSAGLNEAAYKRPEAIILDLGLPDLPGIEVLRQIREWCQTPVLVLSVLEEEDRKVAALDAGADDYLTKPFGESELLARLRALLRRVQPAEEASVVRFGAVEVDLARRSVTKQGNLIKFTAKEYALIRLFMVHRGKVLTHRQILTDLWGPRSDEQTHYLHVYMTRLRQKVEDIPESPKFFLTESGVGYRFVG